MVKTSIEKIDNLEKLRDEYLGDDSSTLKSLSIKYGIPYRVVLKECKDRGWKEQRQSTCENVKNDESPGSNGITENSINGRIPPGEHLKANQMEELQHLRRQAYELATTAARSLYQKEDWNPKEFDLLVGTYVKAVGTQVKMEGAGDILDRLIGELTDTDLIRNTSSDGEDD